jgi:2-polyprenyl-6-methoxyphenol hydroxylase-like FAD-dependent oxidoreductase
MALAIRGYAPLSPDRVASSRSCSEPAPCRRTLVVRPWRRAGERRLRRGPPSQASAADPPAAAAAPELLLPGSAAGATGWRGHHLPLSSWSWPHPDGRVLLAGDAAGLVNPLTGEGIYYAVATGLIAGRTAAEAVTDGTCHRAGATHRSETRQLLARHLRHTALAARLSRHGPVLDVGLRAAAAHRQVFDDLVELGLGRGRITPAIGRGLVAAAVDRG